MVKEGDSQLPVNCQYKISDDIVDINVTSPPSEEARALYKAPTEVITMVINDKMDKYDLNMMDKHEISNGVLGD